MWIDINEKKPPVGKPVLVSDGDYVGLAMLWLPCGFTCPLWRVPGVSGYEWELDEPTHWQEIALPEPPKDKS